MRFYTEVHLGIMQRRLFKIVAVASILMLTALMNPYTGALLHAQEYDPNDLLCSIAAHNKEGAWDWDQRYPRYVAEAIRRGLTVEACRQLAYAPKAAPGGQPSAAGPSGNTPSFGSLPVATQFGSLPVATQLFIAAVILLVLVGLGWLVRQSGGVPAPPVPFAKIIDKVNEFSLAGFVAGLGGAMLAISSFIAFMQFVTATTVFQEIAALLIWIGSSAFWGVFIIGGLLARRQTHLVYSDLLTNLEKNIARLEKLQEQASSVNAVADAITPSQQVHTGG